MYKTQTINDEKNATSNNGVWAARYSGESRKYRKRSIALALCAVLDGKRWKIGTKLCSP